MTAMLEIGDLHVSYGQVDAVRGVSLNLEHGQIISVIGPNGAGKTTLLAAAMGLLPCKGLLRFEGEDLHGLDVEARVERGLCLVPEKRELFGELSVLDNLQLGAFGSRLRSDALKKRLQGVYDRFPRLAERRDQRADTLSGGERQMLAVGRALMSRPTLLMLDEPSLGLAPLVVQEIFRTVQALRATGVTILLVEQNARAALEVADHGYVLEMGSVSLEGEARKLAVDSRVIDTYLGAAKKAA
jgi:branched-chain amino acid transport system ATP-binding protein